MLESQIVMYTITLPSFEVEKAMEGHILAKTQLMGRYKRRS
ncbi:MAG TPA: hypothetical protein ACFYEK_07800 [Candidatus Wunengus sp. YC60]